MKKVAIGHLFHCKYQNQSKFLLKINTLQKSNKKYFPFFTEITIPSPTFAVQNLKLPG